MFPKAGRRTSTVHCIEKVRSGEWGISSFLLLLFLDVYTFLSSVVKPQSSNSLKTATAHGMVAEHRVWF